MQMHRKAWEYCYIVQALHECGMLAPGRRGLGFAVGQEPLSAMFASLGCEIVASDLDMDKVDKAKWVETNQHAASLEVLNQRGICEADSFRRRVTFRFLDMRELPDGLGTFDFMWSSCSLEHLGTIAQGEKFILESLKYLKPGGVAVHTTEFNVRSNLLTLTRGPIVVFRRRDLERIAKRLGRLGYAVDLDFSSGNLPYDKVIDRPPYKEEIHLKLWLSFYVVTSFGLIIERPRGD
ncbi:MAG: class I SAM-dependent methyltransferase [Candidatus Eisenbacteria bacterium]|nr:class I SAM-dependent methyltransferase [Candidatus Eisenbacteria bacterium]